MPWRNNATTSAAARASTMTRVPPVLGADSELANFLVGDDIPPGTAPVAARLLLQQFERLHAGAWPDLARANSAELAESAFRSRIHKIGGVTSWQATVAASTSTWIIWRFRCRKSDVQLTS